MARGDDHVSERAEGQGEEEAISDGTKHCCWLV